MNRHLWKRTLSSFRIIIIGFLGVILFGTLLLMLPFSSAGGQWTSPENALFTATSAVCVTGLVVKDTATYWSMFGQLIILILIQIGGLGIVSITAFITIFSGRKVSLLQREVLQESISAHQIGGIVKMTRFIFVISFIVETTGVLLLLPAFCSEYGMAGIWMAVFHSVSAFCNAGFDIMGGHTGKFSSLTHFSTQIGVVLPICLLIIIGGIGFLTWADVAQRKHHLKRYSMQSKAIIVTTAILIIVPSMSFFYHDFSAFPMQKRLWLSIFQAVTPRTAGFNTADLTAMTGSGRAIIIMLMLVGGSPGSTAGGMKTTTIAVLFANAIAVFRKRKNPKLFGRRIKDETVKTASALLIMYLSLPVLAALFISAMENLTMNACLFETASAIGTVGLSLGITASLGTGSHIILILLMFFGRVGGLTLMFAAINSRPGEVSKYPIEKIMVG